MKVWARPRGVCKPTHCLAWNSWLPSFRELEEHLSSWQCASLPHPPTPPRPLFRVVVEERVVLPLSKPGVRAVQLMVTH